MVKYPRTHSTDAQIAQYQKQAETIGEDGNSLSQGHQSLQAWFKYLVKQAEVQFYLNSQDYDGLQDWIHPQLYIPGSENKISIPENGRDIISRIEKESGGRIEIIHHGIKSYHRITECEATCDDCESYYFLELTEKPGINHEAIGSCATYKFYFQLVHWQAVLEVLRDLLQHELFYSRIQEAKIKVPFKSAEYAVPAVIYLYGVDEISDINTFLKHKLEGLTIDCPVPGGARQGEYFYYTEHQPDCKGCQPLSRSKILASALLTNFIHSSLTPAQAISRSAKLLGYQANVPEKLQEPAPCFYELLESIQKKQDDQQIDNGGRQDSTASLRQVVIRSLTDYFRITSVADIGPWAFSFDTKSEYHFPEEKIDAVAKKVFVSIQFREGDLQNCLERFHSCIEHCREFLKQVNICIRDPDDPRFRAEPCIVVYQMLDDPGCHFIKRLKTAFDNGDNSDNCLLHDIPLPGLCKEQDGIYTAVSYHQLCIPSVYEFLEGTIVKTIREIQAGGCTVPLSIVLRERLYLCGRKGHDPSLAR